MNELSIIDIKNPLEVFSASRGLDAIIDKIEAEVKKIDRDISTSQGRENIRSIAHKLAKSKNALDKMGKELTEAQRQQINAVNAERSRAWDRMEALQAEIRKPLTDWENAEKNRVEGHEKALLYIQQLSEFSSTPTTEEIEERIRAFSALAPRDWQEFGARYNDTVKILSGALEVRLNVSKKQDAERADLERLRKEETDRKQKEHEERIAKEAAEKVRVIAEEKARKEAEAAAIKAKAEQDRLEIEKQEAIARTKKAEDDAREAKAKAERDKIIAEEKAKKDAEEAAQRERDKIAAEKKLEADATAKREANKKHKAKINNEVRSAILAAMDTNDALTDQAKAIVIAIANGGVPHVKIQY